MQPPDMFDPMPPQHGGNPAPDAHRLPSRHVAGDMVVRLRAAQREDLSAVLELLRRAGLQALQLEVQFGPQYTVAEAADGTLIGVAGIERYGTIGLLRSAAVAPDSQGRGIGRLLVADRLRWARTQELQALYLLTEGAAGYWRRFGFDRIDRRAVPPALHASAQWTLCPTSAVPMRLTARGGGEHIDPE